MMQSIQTVISPESVLDNILNGLENFCEELNNFFLILFIYLKYIFVLILFMLGLLTLFRLRGKYFDIKANNMKREEEPLHRTRIVLGVMYILFATGILLNFFTLFLIIILEPLPDRLIYNFIKFFTKDIDPYLVNRIENIDVARFAHERTIYYLFALISYIGFIDLFFSIWYFLNNRSLDKPRHTIKWLLSSLIIEILFGFTPFLKFFL